MAESCLPDQSGATEDWDFSYGDRDPDFMGRLEYHDYPITGGTSSLLWQAIMSQTGMSSSPHSGCVSEDQFSTKSDELSNIRVKLMCSYGGRILPRPHDGQLRYIGGETRILTADRNITLPELLQKVRRLAGKSMLFKYQLPGEDLDSLVSVRTEEDLENMMDEFDKLAQRELSARMRVFLFPEKVHGHHAEVGEEVSSTEQQFLDALNGVPIPQVTRVPHRRSPAVSPKLPDNLDVGDDESGLFFGFPRYGKVNSPHSPRSLSPHKLPPAQIPLVEPPVVAFQVPVDNAGALRQHYYVPDHHLPHYHQQQTRSNSRSPTSSPDVESSRNRAFMSPSRFRDPVVTPPAAARQTPPYYFYQNKPTGDEVDRSKALH